MTMKDEYFTRFVVYLTNILIEIPTETYFLHASVTGIKQFSYKKLKDISFMSSNYKQELFH